MFVFVWVCVHCVCPVACCFDVVHTAGNVNAGIAVAWHCLLRNDLEKRPRHPVTPTGTQLGKAAIERTKA